jgi:hypothetical protein
LQEKLGGTFIVDNKGGAGGAVGAAQVKRSAPDGNTFLVTSLGPLVIGPHLIKNPGYDPLKDFDYITVAVQAPNILVVPANSPHKSLADVVAFHKKNPGKMSFASAGNGSSDHLTAELFWQTTGTICSAARSMRSSSTSTPASRTSGAASCAHWRLPVRSARRSCPTYRRWKNSASKASRSIRGRQSRHRKGCPPTSRPRCTRQWLQG